MPKRCLIDAKRCQKMLKDGEKIKICPLKNLPAMQVGFFIQKTMSKFLIYNIAPRILDHTVSIPRSLTSFSFIFGKLFGHL